MPPPLADGRRSRMSDPVSSRVTAARSCELELPPVDEGGARERGGEGGDVGAGVTGAGMQCRLELCERRRGEERVTGVGVAPVNGEERVASAGERRGGRRAAVERRRRGGRREGVVAETREEKESRARGREEERQAVAETREEKERRVERVGERRRRGRRQQRGGEEGRREAARLTGDLNPVVTLSPFLRLSEWFLHELLDPTGFELAQGQNFLDFVGHDAKFAKIFNDAMVAGSSFMMDIVVTKCSDVFHGISSLLDVAGGLGGASQAISKVFPHVKCSVLDLPHVVAAAPTRTNVEYIAGDMFQSIPPTNTVFLKWVLHDWGDAECVKILRNCKNVIPLRDAGGKVLIFDMVVRAGTFDIKHRETQVLFDLFIMIVDGVERGEQGWKKIILEAGFSDYKIIPVVGVRSIIEVHP
ncbi:hypothetical protein PR202_ga05664 [Eleusine coracana subsp. coracana]|uniref:O-methyltransferase C-terminal domain-containing protein n=1 Tax=Eleusine coracana subsp. coracana TaxID=191504 RepID=A0AAV5BRX0_ELECO|nr:hypothetical protein PR202_ga05210 [Eleusine coracana subsp. coracana]GJM89469.1 hypothetical protein PR202_ga05664 [Eleusine coracana subsp. coracana]